MIENILKKIKKYIDFFIFYIIFINYIIFIDQILIFGSSKTQFYANREFHARQMPVMQIHVVPSWSQGLGWYLIIECLGSLTIISMV